MSHTTVYQWFVTIEYREEDGPRLPEPVQELL